MIQDFRFSVFEKWGGESSEYFLSFLCRDNHSKWIKIVSREHCWKWQAMKGISKIQLPSHNHNIVKPKQFHYPRILSPSWAFPEKYLSNCLRGRKLLPALFGWEASCKVEEIILQLSLGYGLMFYLRGRGRKIRENEPADNVGRWPSFSAVSGKCYQGVVHLMLMVMVPEGCAINLDEVN